jgi:flagellar hook assembly protein FlgD
MNAAEPNPARDHSRVAFTMQRGGEARVDVFNAAGERIRTLLESHQAAGSHEVVWDGRDDNGSAVGSGVYFFRLDALGQESTRRLVLVR